jgi:hypothetical protein
MRVYALLLSCFLLLGGCARFEIGGVSALGSLPVAEESGDIGESDSAPMFHMRIGFNPLQGYRKLHDRSWDVGGGYLAQFFWPDGGNRIFYQGFHLEGAYFPWSTSVGTSSFRLCLIGNAEVILSDFSGQAEVGPGGSLGVYIEWTGMATTDYSKEAKPIGAFLFNGEWGIGLGLSAGYRRLYDRDYFTVFLGMSFRLPVGIEPDPYVN